MTANLFYPVPERSPLRNKRIAAHEIGHALCGRAVGSTVLSVTIIPCSDGSNAYQGRTVRSGAKTELALADDLPSVTSSGDVVSLCERLERLTPEIGSNRVKSGVYYQIAQSNIVELLGASACELALFPDLPPLNAPHDLDEAVAFARVAVVARPAVAALLEYCRAEATAIITDNLDVARALVEALEEVGVLSGEQVDQIISNAIAYRAIEAERVRREDWRRRELSSAAFVRTALCTARDNLCLDSIAG